MHNKPLPLGIDDFEKLITNDYCYIDKTLFIKELLDKKGEVNLFTRPRRFGKTLNMSMLRYFFEDTGNEQENQKNRELFNGLQIMAVGNNYTAEMNQYPVISLSLKSAKQPTWELSYLMLRRQIAAEFKRHQYVTEKLSENDREHYQHILCVSDDMGYFVDALAFLSGCLEQYYNKKVIILIDEYDVPLENAYFRDFYSPMVDFIRSLFESALKTNSSLYFAVITGCLRITKESIFTGLNNLKINSVLSGDYGEYFGFTPAEVEQMLDDYGCSDHKDTVQEWYDGYLFGNKEVYNPWSVLNYVYALIVDPQDFPRPYWANTSSNSIIRSLVERADLSTRMEIESLIAGETITKPIHEDITYEDVHTSMDNLWNFLFFTGYLKKNSSYLKGNKIYLELSIPNIEILEIYKDKIVGWFEEKIEQKDMSLIYRNILEGNKEGFQHELTELLQDTISFHDDVEAFYHGFMIGILGQLRTHIVKSNRESGDGRYDILVRSLRLTQPIIIMELKFSKTYDKLEKDAVEALEQIEEKSYDREFKQEGYQRSIRYGITFYKKNCLIKKEEIEF